MRLCVVLVGLFAIGCVHEPYLQWARHPPAPTPPQGRVSVRYVIGKRPEKRGDGDLSNIGNWRSGFGIPYPIRLQPPDHPLDVTMSQFLVEALNSAGIAVTPLQDPGASSHLSLEILDFWCDGYMGYKATVSLMLFVLDPRTGGVRAQVPLQREGAAGPGFFQSVQLRCKDAYTNALNAIQNDLMNALVAPQVRSAALGTAPPPAPMQPTQATPPQ
jgi:hypothetical protein